MAICGNEAVALVLTNFRNSTRALKRPGATQPTREPGDKVLVKESHNITQPSVSKALADLGRVGPKVRLP